MDLDGFLAARQERWQRLAELVRRAEAAPARLAAAEVDELVRLYLGAASDLSRLRTTYGQARLAVDLDRLVAHASAAVYGTRPRTLAAVRRFVVTTFPAAVWHARTAVVVAAGVFLAVAVAVGVWIATSEAAFAAAAPPEVRDAYLERDFEAYYSSQPAGQFAALVFTNNARVGIAAFAFGIGLCVPTLLVLAFNGANLGLAAGLFHAAGQATRFWGLVLPHGLLELTAVFVAGASGLRLGWAVVAPGDRTRRDALADEGRRAVAIVVGLVAVFLVAGVIEAYVTPSGLPTRSRVAIGGVASSLFVAYVVVAGRRAAARGLTGALGEDDVPGVPSAPVVTLSRSP